MDYLNTIDIEGAKEDIANVIRRFGALYIGKVDDDEHLAFRLKRFPNPFQPNGQAMFVLVPSVRLEQVWTSLVEHVEVRIGVGKHHMWADCIRKTDTAVAVFQADGVILYVCLDPDGDLLVETDSFGI